MEKNEYKKMEGIVSDNKDFVQGALFAYKHCIKMIEDEKFTGSNNHILCLVSKHLDLCISKLKGVMSTVEQTNTVPDFDFFENEEMKKLNKFMKDFIIKMYDMGDKLKKGDKIGNED